MLSTQETGTSPVPQRAREPGCGLGAAKVCEYWPAPEPGNAPTATRARSYKCEAPAALATRAPISSANPGVRTFSYGSPNVTLFELGWALCTAGPKMARSTSSGPSFAFAGDFLKSIHRSTRPTKHSCPGQSYPPSSLRTTRLGVADREESSRVGHLPRKCAKPRVLGWQSQIESR